MSFIGTGSCDVSECRLGYFILMEGTPGDVDPIDPGAFSRGKRTLVSYFSSTGQMRSERTQAITTLLRCDRIKCLVGD